MLRMGISSLFYRLSDVTASVCAGEIRASPEAWEFKKTSWREQAVSATFPINQSSCFCKFRLCDCLSYSLALYFGFHQWKILHEVTHLRFLHNSLNNKKKKKQDFLPLLFIWRPQSLNVNPGEIFSHWKAGMSSNDPNTTGPELTIHLGNFDFGPRLSLPLWRAFEITSALRDQR